MAFFRKNRSRRFRRRLGRRVRRSRGSRGMTYRRVARIAQGVMNADAETKRWNMVSGGLASAPLDYSTGTGTGHFDPAIQGADVVGAPLGYSVQTGGSVGVTAVALTQIGACATGANNSQRVGNKIDLQSILIKHYFALKTTSASGPVLLQLIRDCAPRGLLPSPVDIWDADAGGSIGITSLRNRTNLSRFQIIGSKMLYLSGADISAKVVTLNCNLRRRGKSTRVHYPLNTASLVSEGYDYYWAVRSDLAKDSLAGYFDAQVTYQDA